MGLKGEEDIWVGVFSFLQFFDLGDGQEGSLPVTLWSLALFLVSSL